MHGFLRGDIAVFDRYYCSFMMIAAMLSLEVLTFVAVNTIFARLTLVAANGSASTIT